LAEIMQSLLLTDSPGTQVQVMNCL